MKEYKVYNLEYLYLETDNEDNLILYASDRLNIKLFKYDVKSKEWDKNYFILKHNEIKTIKLYVENGNQQKIVAYLENGYILKFVVIYDMYRLDVVEALAV